MDSFVSHCHHLTAVLLPLVDAISTKVGIVGDVNKDWARTVRVGCIGSLQIGGLCFMDRRLHGCGESLQNRSDRGGWSVRRSE